MSLREDKTELISKLFMLEKEKSAIELKLKYVEGQQNAQAAALKNLQGQLKDTEALLALATQNRVSILFLLYTRCPEMNFLIKKSIESLRIICLIKEY